MYYATSASIGAIQMQMGTIYKQRYNEPKNYLKLAPQDTFKPSINFFSYCLLPGWPSSTPRCTKLGVSLSLRNFQTKKQT